MKQLKIGTRGSALALAQTKLLVEQLERIDSAIETEIVILHTQGDRDRSRPLSTMGGKGVFVSEMEQALQEGKIDLAVHSAKDMPVELGKGLVIGAVLPRGDHRDVLVTRVDAPLNRAQPCLIGTGSQRRQRQLGQHFPMSEFRDIRGNVDTRLGKLGKGEYDGIVLAGAGLKRLGLDRLPGFSYTFFTAEQFLPAACQGIIAVESREEPELTALLAQIDHRETRLIFETERHVLRCLGADCTMPAGAFASVQGNRIRLMCTKDSLTKQTGETEINRRLQLAEELVTKL